MAVGRCKTCKWWERDEQAVDWGKCRRRAPSNLHPAEAHRQNERPESVWPGTSGADWCGDYHHVVR